MPRPRPALRTADLPLGMFPALSPAPSPASTPATRTERTTLLYSTSPSVPSLVLTPPPPSFLSDGDILPDYIAHARRRRRRTPPPSPGLLCVGYRRRPDSFADPYGLVSDKAKAKSRAGPAYSLPFAEYRSGMGRAAAGAIVILSELDIAGSVAGMVASSVASFSALAAGVAGLATDHSLPLYARKHRKRSPRPLVAFFAFLLLALALALSLAVRGTLLSVSSPLANKSHTAYPAAHPYGRGRYYMHQQSRHAQAQAQAQGQAQAHAPKTYPAAHGPLDAASYYRVQSGSVGVTLPKARKIGEMKSIVEAFSGGVLNPWDFH